jgi:anti-anti-sigma factor
LVSIESRRTDDGVVLLGVSGEIDMATVDTLRDALMTAVTAGDGAAVVVDFAGVSFCDSSGMQALDAAYATAASRGIGFEVINLQPTVRRVLGLVGILDTLTKPLTAMPQSDLSPDLEPRADCDRAE